MSKKKDWVLVAERKAEQTSAACREANSLLADRAARRRAERRNEAPRMHHGPNRGAKRRRFKHSPLAVIHNKRVTKKA